jgi:hypothetical protein
MMMMMMTPEMLSAYESDVWCSAVSRERTRDLAHSGREAIFSVLTKKTEHSFIGFCFSSSVIFKSTCWSDILALLKTDAARRIKWLSLCDGPDVNLSVPG